MYHFIIDLNKKEFIRFRKFILFKTDACKKNTKALRLLLPMLLFYTTLMIMVAKPDMEALKIISLIHLAIIIIWFFAAKAFLLLEDKKLMMLYSENKKEYLSDKDDITFEDDFIYLKEKCSESKAKYSIIKKIYLTENEIYIGLSVKNYIMIPFDRFSDETQRQCFFKFLFSKVEKSKIVRTDA